MTEVSLCDEAVVDPGLPVGGGASPPNYPTFQIWVKSSSDPFAQFSGANVKIVNDDRSLVM